MSTRIGNTPTINSFPGFSEQAPWGVFFSRMDLIYYVAGGKF
jgi:hypothetical protein